MRFVIQGQNILPEQLDQIAVLCGSHNFHRINAHAFYLAVDQESDAVIAYCSEHQIDAAFVPADQTLDRFGLVVMDMDSTLISIECIDEIADMQGLKPQVAAITESAMRGEIEFAESLRRRVALLEGLDESALQRVYDERLRFNPGAETLIGALRSRRIKTLLVSGGFTFFTERIKARIGLDYAEANTLEVFKGKLTGKVLGTILDAQGKAEQLLKVRAELGLAQDQVIAIGDGANDLKMMAEAHIGIAYHAKPLVRAQATYALSHVGLDGVLNLFTADS